MSTSENVCADKKPEQLIEWINHIIKRLTLSNLTCSGVDAGFVFDSRGVLFWDRLGLIWRAGGDL